MEKKFWLGRKKDSDSGGEKNSDSGDNHDDDDDDDWWVYLAGMWTLRDVENWACYKFWGMRRHCVTFIHAICNIVL